MDFLKKLQDLIDERRQEMPEGSYTTKLFRKGINKIAQKVGEESVELIIEAKDSDDERFLNEVSPHPLTRAQFCFLKLIALNPDLQVGEVARFLGVSSAAGSKNVDKLERYGLVNRGGSPGER